MNGILWSFCLLISCNSSQWDRGSAYSPQFWGNQPTATHGSWIKSVNDGAAMWAAAFDLNCPFPFTEDLTNSVPGRKFIALVANEVWDKPGYTGWTDSAGIRISGDNVYNKRAIIAHEFGHALGLVHNNRITSIMYPNINIIRSPDYQDLAEARAFGCK